MTKSPPVIELSWRDENYGSVCAVAAFRNYAGTLDWSDRTHQRFRGCLKRAGFAFHDGRCSYIATSGTRRTIPSASPCKVTKPMPAAASRKGASGSSALA